ncbi:MAG: peptide-modifying radical SAM enzyme CbpB [Omnitrophica bacterium]|nr:peptide-modifying radical SAM enzyme CbpB [Candidatus Omnitrophota bacterium]
MQIRFKQEQLQKEDIDSKMRLLIDPDNVFWGLIDREKMDNQAEEKISVLGEKFKSNLDQSMRDFRSKVDVNSVYINPTDRCNANCPYCYIPARMRRSGKHLGTDELTYILKKIDNYFKGSSKKLKFKPMVIYHGSEPLLVKDLIFSSIEKFSKKFNFGVQTNAILLEKKDVKFLKSQKVSVGISLDSLDKKVNDYTRRSQEGNNYDKAIRVLEWFKGYEGLSVITTLTKYNLKGLPKLVEFMHSKRVGCFLLNPVRITRNSVLRLKPKDKELTKAFLGAIKKAVEISKKSKHRIIIGNFSNIILGIVAPSARRLMCDISPCGGARCFFAITANGDMVPCGEFISLEEFYAGNIFKDSIKKALYSKQFKKIRSRIVEKIEECDVCNYRNICGAPCPAESYSANKDLNVKSPYCEFYKEIIKYAFKLIAEDKIKYLFRKEAFKNVKYEYYLKAG